MLYSHFAYLLENFFLTIYLLQFFKDPPSNIANKKKIKKTDSYMVHIPRDSDIVVVVVVF